MFDQPVPARPRATTAAQVYLPQMPPLPAQVVADMLRDRLPDLDKWQLHKLLYYCQGHHLATFGHKLFGDSVSAFDHGPVIARVWYAESSGEPEPVGTSRPATEAELNTVGYVVSRYGRLTGAELRAKTHEETPYKLGDAGRPPGSSKRIEEKWMEDFFREETLHANPRAYTLPPLVKRLIESGELETPRTDADVDDPEVMRAQLAQLRRATRRNGIG